MSKLVRDAALYLAAVVVLGTAANFVPQRHLEWWGKLREPPREGVDFTLIDPGSADAERTSLPGVLFLDTRTAAEFAAGHVPGARRISYTDLARQWTPQFAATLRGANVLVVYGASDETDLEQLLAQELRHRGVPPPQVLMGGFGAWKQGAFPVEGGGS
jgi:rhodanese-related sulfurtransferase